MKIALVTLCDHSELPYVKLSNGSKKDYCKLHGYDFVYYDRNLCPDKHPVWAKIPAVLNIIDKYDYVFWVDADAVIANKDFKVETLFGEKDIYVSVDIKGINFGIFAVKNSETSKKFLKKIYEMYPLYFNKVFKEQQAASDLIMKDPLFSKSTEIVDIKKWNCYDDVYPHPVNNKFQEGDFILHRPWEKYLNTIKPNYRELRFKQVLGK